MPRSSAIEVGVNHVQLLSSIIAACLVFSTALADDYKLTLQANGEELAVIELSITDDKAIAKVGDITELFDLKEQRWQHDDTKQWVTLSESVSSTRKSKEKAEANLASIPETNREFFAWSLNPKFEVTATDDTLVLTSGQIDYKIKVEKFDSDPTNYFRYAKLNAYKKSITERKLPPFAELYALEELERRKLMPKKMEVDMPGIPGAPSFTLVVSTNSRDDDSDGN